LAVGVLSIKILYVIHNLMKGQHFLFWILSSLEWQTNSMRKDFGDFRKELKKMLAQSNAPDQKMEKSNQ